MRHSRRKGFALVLLAIVAAVPMAPAIAADYWVAARPDVEELLDEAVVQGHRLLDLRVAMVEAEDRFYARYNELNRRDEFDIQCLVYQGIDTHFTQRHCSTRAWEQAVHEESVAVYDVLDRAGHGGDSAARPRSLPANLKLGAMFPEYQQNMLELLRKDRQLQRLAREREQLQVRYDTERRRRMSGKLARLE